MKRIAVLLTVYNRRNTTLIGLKSLFRSVNHLDSQYLFDIYMTDDGSTDGTTKAVREVYPNIIILNGDGNLYWSGGMRQSWQAAIDSKLSYDYYLWFNDDAELYENAISILMKAAINLKSNGIISGAFCDTKGNVSYGGRSDMKQLIKPNGKYQHIMAMNGNLVLVPKKVFDSIGIIDKIFKHGLGDFDYGLRAQKQGFEVILTDRYVGVTDRHDDDIMSCWNSQYSLPTRISALFSPKNSPKIDFIFNLRHFGLVFALRKLFVTYLFAFFPILYKLHISH